jgi:hypothetical protein
MTAADEDRLLHEILTIAAPIPHHATPPGRDRAPRRRAGLLAGGLGLTAAAVAAAVTAAIIVAPGPAPTPNTPPSAGHQGTARLAARQVLLAAATTAARAPDAAGAYWFDKTTESIPGYRETDKTWSPRNGGPAWVWAGKKTHGRIIKLPSQGPLRFDITGDPGELRQLQGLGPLMVSPGSSRAAETVGQLTIRQLQQLPTDPAALKAKIVAINNRYEHLNGVPDPGHVAIFMSLTTLVAGTPAPSAVRAAAFRAIATLPNVTSLGPVKDGQAVKLALGGNQYATLIVNTATGQARYALTVNRDAGETSSLSDTAHWVNRLP